jgi:putative ABC transport system substrate-binding protein
MPITCTLLVALASSLLMVSVDSDAQQAQTIPTVGILSSISPGSAFCIEPFKAGLHDLGYVEGRTIRFAYRYAEGKPEPLPALAAELAHLTPDILFTWAAVGVLAAQQATTTIPIVVGTADLITPGIITNLAQPDGNITGLTWYGPELIGKRLEVLKEAVPQSTRVGLLGHPDNPVVNRLMRDTLPTVARTLSIEIHRFDIRTTDELEGAFAAMAEHHIGALLVVDEAWPTGHFRHMAELATTHRLPTLSARAGFAAEGGLLEHRLDTALMCRRAATYADKLLKGAKPGDLPIERFERSLLIVNLKTAEALGLTLPPSVLSQADEVIK